MPPGGGFATDILGQVYESFGTPIGEEFSANKEDFRDEQDFDAAPLPDGGFVVVYETEARSLGGGNDASVAVTATEWSTLNGIPRDLGKRLLAVNRTDSRDDNDNPSVTSLGDSRYVVLRLTVNSLPA